MKILKIVMFLTIAFCSSCAEVKNLVVDAEPLFYPTIEQRNRIQYLTTIKTSKALHKPYGIAYHGDKIFLVDSRKPAYLILDPSGKVLKSVSGKGKGRLVKPINISLDRQGNRYVTDSYRKRILKYNKNDRYVRSIGINRRFRPSDINVYGNQLYVSDLKSHRIHIFNKNNGRLLRSFSRPGSKNGELFFPTSISVGRNGEILVSDTGNNRLQLYNNAGYLVKKYGSAGNGLGQFSRPKGVAMDRQGRVYAVDAAFENIQLFNKKGELLLVFGHSGNARGDINLPADIAISYTGIEPFKRYAHKRFKIRYLIFVTSQYGPNKINVYGYGHYRKG